MGIYLNPGNEAFRESVRFLPKTQKAAKKSIWTNTIISVVASALFFFLGTALFVFYKNNLKRRTASLLIFLKLSTQMVMDNWKRLNLQEQWMHFLS